MSLSFDMAEVAQPIPQPLQRWPGLIRENADFPKATLRLRSGGGRPSRRAANQRDELASSHVWMAPSVKRKCSVPHRSRLQSCVRPVYAVRMDCWP
jgi:hypothetical protein